MTPLQIVNDSALTCLSYVTRVVQYKGHINQINMEEINVNKKAKKMDISIKNTHFKLNIEEINMITKATMMEIFLSRIPFSRLVCFLLIAGHFLSTP